MRSSLQHTVLCRHVARLYCTDLLPDRQHGRAEAIQFRLGVLKSDVLRIRLSPYGHQHFFKFEGQDAKAAATVYENYLKSFKEKEQ